MIQRHCAAAQEIKIGAAELLRYAGQRGPADEALKQLAESCAKAMVETIRPRAVSTLFDAVAAGWSFELLLGCESCVIFCASIGAEAEQIVKRNAAPNPAKALLLDAAGSAAIEGYCDLLCAQLAEQYASEGFQLLPRFSPGYGDCPLALQGTVLEITRAKATVGVGLSAGGMLSPQKSVCAICGLKKAGEKK